MAVFWAEVITTAVAITVVTTTAVAKINQHVAWE